MGFNVQDARKAGYSESEIADYLSKNQKFNITEARKSGYDDNEIIDHLTKKQAAEEAKRAEENKFSNRVVKVTKELATDAVKGGLSYLKELTPSDSGDSVITPERIAQSQANPQTNQSSEALANVLPSVAKQRQEEAASQVASKGIYGMPVRDDYVKGKANDLASLPADLQAAAVAQEGIAGRVNKQAISEGRDVIAPAVKQNIEQAADSDAERQQMYGVATNDAKAAEDKQFNESFTASPEKPEGFLETAGNALARTASNTTAMNKSMVALGLDAVGADNLALDMLKSAAESEQTAANFPAAINSYKEIKSWSDVPTYVLEGVLENSGMLAQSMSAGGAGALALKTLGKEKVEGLVADAAKKEIAKRIAIGGAIGAGSSSIGMESGSIFKDIYSETGEMRPAVALAFGTLAGGLDAIPAAHAVSTALKHEFMDEVGKSLIKRYGVDGLKQIAEEGGTEYLQTLIEKGAVSFVNGKPVLTQKNFEEATDAMLKGGAAGGATHVVAQGFNDAQQIPNSISNRIATTQADQAQQKALNAWNTNGLTASTRTARPPVDLTTLSDESLNRLHQTATVALPAQLPAIQEELARRANLGTLEAGLEQSIRAEHPINQESNEPKGVLATAAETVAQFDDPVMNEAVANEAIDGSSLLDDTQGEVNGSQQNDPAQLATATNGNGDNQLQGSVVDVPNQPRGVDLQLGQNADTAATSTGGGQSLVDGSGNGQGSALGETTSNADNTDKLETPKTPTPQEWSDATDSISSVWKKSDRGQRSYIAENMGMGANSLKFGKGKEAKTLSQFEWDEIPDNIKRDMIKQQLANKDKPSSNDKIRKDLVPLVEQLVKRRAHVDKHKSFQPAVDAASALMNGEEISPAKFRNLAKLLKTKDQKTADILTQLADEAENTPMAITAKEAKSARGRELAKQRTRINHEEDNLMVAMAKLGGLNAQTAKSEFGIDPADFKSHGAGILRSFTANGKEADHMRELLLEQGYPVGETVAEFGDAIALAMEGHDVMTSQGLEAIAKREQEEAERMYYELSDDEQNLLDKLVDDATKLLGADVVADIDAQNADANKGNPLGIVERALIDALQEAVSLEKANRSLNEQADVEREVRTANEIRGNEGAGESTTGQASQSSEGATAKSESKQVSDNGNGSQGLELTGETNAEIQAKEKAAEEKRKQESDANKKAEADAGVNDFALTGSNREADVAAASGAQDLFSQDNKQSEKPAQASSEQSLALFKDNKTFKADAVAAARARIKSKLGNINSGIDPELLIDGMTIAGAYIEAGVRSFSAYSKAMVDDFGEGIKPYLLSFYEAARAYPNIDKTGMTSAADAADMHDAALTPAVIETVKDVIGQGIQEAQKTKAKPNGQATLTQDWGVEHIDGWTDNKDGTGTNERENGVTNGVKDQFLAEAKKYLTQVSKLLEAEGYEPHQDRRGRAEKPVSVNESGVATSGEVSMVMRKGGAGVYVTVGTSSVRGLTGKHPQGVSVMMRATGKPDANKFATDGGNIWLDTNLSATELANKLMQTAERYVKNNEAENKENDNANSTQSQELPKGSNDSNQQVGADGSISGEQMDAGVASTNEGADPSKRVSSGVSESTGTGAGSSSELNGNTPNANGKNSDGGAVNDAASGELDHTIEDGDNIGKGSALQKYNDNIAAIKIIKAIESEGRKSTLEERKQLAKYVGWGGLKGVFDPNNKQWNKQYNELKSLLTKEEFESARASILNSHFTSPVIVKGIYDAVEKLGFRNGRVLEPSMGSGNFFGMMPLQMRDKSNLHGVELDNLTSRLASALYPNAVIATSTGFQDYQVPQGYFDMAIGNPPFGSETIVDKDRSKYSGLSIHNYFIAKMLDKVREGGIVPVVVSHSFLDAMTPKARELIASQANLVAGVRLPYTAFKENAGTDVITDILFFQKTSTPDKNPDWLHVSDGDYTYNHYFIANPNNVLGKLADATNQYGKTYTIEPTGDLQAQLNDFIERLPKNIYSSIERSAEELDSADNTIPDGVKAGSYFVNDKGEIRQRNNDVAGMKTSSPWTAKNASEERRMAGMVELRDLLRNQLRIERDGMANEQQIEQGRKKLNDKYDAFVKANGFVNSQINRRVFVDDTESALVQALEFNYDAGVTKAKAESSGLEEKAPSADKADIMKRRVLFPPSEVLNVNNAKDALLASMNIKGQLNMDYMKSVYDKSQDEILSELGDLVYEDPALGFVDAERYLSGDVKTKLKDAQFAADSDSKFKRNVEALKKVIPTDKMPSEIYAAIGAGWISPKTYQDFAKEITGSDNITVGYLAPTAQWFTENGGRTDIGKMESEYGTDKMNSYEIFSQMLNGKPVEVKKRIADSSLASGYRLVTDEEATEAARQRMDKIKSLWDKWIWDDANRANELAGIYNEKFNRTVERGYDGSHLTLPASSPTIQLRAHQKDAVWRALQERNVLLDHAVGAGKTFVMAAIAMEMKRLGIARKPFFAVPNHLTMQWRTEFSMLYPAANVLAATPEDFNKENRERMFSKIATGDYDAIIVGHSSLTKIGLDIEIEKRMYDEQIESISSAIEAAKEARGDRGIVRDMEKIKVNLESKIQELINKAGERDKVVTFNELGIDMLAVDEMHEFKNLFFTTQKQRVSGLGNPKGSGKAFDLFMKIRWLQETLGEKAPLITATGTPVSNSLSEMFTMQRFMRFDELKSNDLNMFDAWSRMYGEDEYVYEVAPSGVGYRISQRFSKFKNLPSLMGHYKSFADVITLQDLKDQATSEGNSFPVPKIKGGRQTNIVAQRSDLQRDFFGVPVIRKDEQGNFVFQINNPQEATITQDGDGKWVLKTSEMTALFETKEEAELELAEKSMSPVLDLDPNSLVGKFNNLKELTRSSKGKINALSLTGLANKAGLDYRLIDPAAPDFEGSKINQAVTNMVSIYKETEKDKGAQIVFCDLSIPLSARTQAANKDKRLYVLDDSRQSLTHKNGTLHTVENREGFPFYLVKSGKGANASIQVYEPVSGAPMMGGYADKKSAQEAMAKFLESESNRERWFDTRSRYEPITMERIAEYRDEKELEVAEDGSNEISTDDLEAMSGSSQFSVYDDIKTKLIKAGVKEHEIAFIHDYNTPKQKQELFKRVKSGDVRFLMGSTPKLGAGTNVQTRLVALHHIDAPWRPSDLEQREGRIIRQGNELYKRDPENFEVFIGRYATEQTYDTRRWQLLEHKAAGIEQLRKYSGEAEIDDVTSEAANAADMKAAASGNPLILEETQLRTEVKRLTALQKAHADGKYSMQRKLQANKNAVDKFIPEKIAEIESLISIGKSNPLPQDKDAIASFSGDGKTAKTREQAENIIADISAKVRISPLGYSKEVTYRGMQFTFDAGLSGSVVLNSPIGVMNNFNIKDSISPSGVITRLNNFIDRLDDRKQEFEAESDRLKKDIASMEAYANDKFEQEAELEQAKEKHGQIQRALMKSTQMDAVPEGERADFNKQLETRKAELAKLGYQKAIDEANKDAPRFSRTLAQAQRLPKKSVESLVASIRTNWKNAPEIIIVEDMNDPAIREEVRAENERQLSQGAEGQPEGFFDNGKVYIVASEMNNTNDVVRVLFHETLGHFGLRGLYGKGLKSILEQVALMRKSEITAKAKQYGLDANKQSDLLIAAEEVLAEMAQKNPQLGFVKRAISAIRNWLRANVPALKNLKLTDADIIQGYLIPARNFVIKQGAGKATGNAMFSRSPQANLAPTWDNLEDSGLMEDAIRALQDQHIDLKRVIKSIEKTGANIDDQWNAYLQEELYHGRTAKRTQDFLNDELTPLIEDMSKRGVTMQEFEQYLWARHAEERNNQIATINEDLPDGGSGMLTQDAKDYLDGLSTEQRDNFEALAKRIDAITKQSNQVLLDYGLESTDTIQAWNDTYKYYVPLQREDMDIGFGSGTGQGFSVKGSATKRALGSSKNVVDIIANIAMQREKNIVRGEKNRVATALIGLAKLNPNDDFWQVDTPPTIKSINKATGLVEHFTDPNYKTQDNVVVARIKNRLGKIEERSVTFNKYDERAMNISRAIKNLEIGNTEALIEGIGKLTRYFASVNTQYNPIFGVLNIARDIQGSLLNLTTTPLAGKQTEVLKNTLPALKAIYSSMRSKTKGTQLATNDWTRLFEEFQREGGQTGYRDMFKNASDRTKAIEKSLDPTWWTKTKLGKVATVNGLLVVPETMLNDEVIKPVFDWLSDYNETLENAVRLSVYKSGLDAGLSKQQSASIAKNISVNFNRKGNKARSIGMLYAFFNASIQGTARIVETLKGRRGKQIIAGGLLLGAMQALALAAMGFDDDEPPEFVKDRNIIIPIGNKKYLMFPMPLGFNAIPNLGRIFTEWALSGGKDTPKRISHIFGMLADTLNPIGGNGSIANMVAPTVLDPVIDLANNKDFTGKPIAKQDFNSLQPTTGFSRTKDTASSVSKGMAYAINYLTGGTDYKQGVFSPTPDQIDYLIGQATGGVGRELMKAEQTATSLVTGEDLPTHKIPLVGRFYGDANAQSSQGGKFYDNIIKLNEHEAEVKGRRKDGKDYQQYLNDNPEARMIGQGNLAEKQVSALRRKRKEMVEKGADKSEVHKVDEMITARMKRFNDLMSAKGSE